ncbi:TPA: hypothetical protein GX533_02790 [Candidatus Dojkabacteria bacterium]|jgi:type II secretory pathway pseudopilin PulG|uniref:Type II secretion system protein n=1 Tax=Candidatus Dojkabacteria bacterium TaxID=2099670 RepID=A0A832QCG3_9BACT|nr:hypothetical protein [Candidatus Dojkabacteria bacterium]
MRNKKKIKLKGLTLLETLLYVALFSMILFVIINFMLGTQEATRRNMQRSSVHQSAQFVKQHFDYSFQKVIQVSEGSSIFNNDNGKLTLIFSDTSKSYTISNNRIYFNDIAITPKNISATKLHFEPIYSKKGVVMAIKVSTKLVTKKDPKIFEEITYLAVIR